EYQNAASCLACVSARVRRLIIHSSPLCSSFVYLPVPFALRQINTGMPIPAARHDQTRNLAFASRKARIIPVAAVVVKAAASNTWPTLRQVPPGPDTLALWN